MAIDIIKVPADKSKIDIIILLYILANMKVTSLWSYDSLVLWPIGPTTHWS